jgi:hypothetical protein
MVSRKPLPAELGIEPACAVLEFPSSTYYAARKRQREASARSVRDESLKKEIKRVWQDRKIGRRVYGARKVWRPLHPEGTIVARCTVERLMGELGIAGAAARRRKPRTTVPAPVGLPFLITVTWSYWCAPAGILRSPG